MGELESVRYEKANALNSLYTKFRETIEGEALRRGIKIGIDDLNPPSYYSEDGTTLNPPIKNFAYFQIRRPLEGLVKKMASQKLHFLPDYRSIVAEPDQPNALLG